MTTTAPGKEYLVATGKGNLWPLKDRLKELRGFFTGDFWAFPIESETEIRKLLEPFKGIGVYTQPMNPGQTFESYRQIFKASFFKKRLKSVEEEIAREAKRLNIQEMSEETVGSTNIDKEERDEILNLLGERNDLNLQISHAESMAEALSNSQEEISIPLFNVEDSLQREQEFLDKYRGKDVIGLRTKFIPQFNSLLKGLRGFMLIAAAPNVGKTALTVQTSLEILGNNEEACMVFLSLEMNATHIFRRMILCLAGLTFNKYVFGSVEQAQMSPDGECSFFTTEEFKSIEMARKKLLSYGDRLQIIDRKMAPTLDSDTTINFINRVKTQSKCSRVAVVADYMQVWPVNPKNKTFSDNDSDKWRIGELQKIRDAIGEDNPLIVISEARKPSGSSKDSNWTAGLSDVMGSARGSYAPDVVMFLSEITKQDVERLLKKNRVEEVVFDRIKSGLKEKGVSLVYLEASKVRDGMERFRTPFSFHYRENKFETTAEEVIKMLENEEESFERNTSTKNQTIKERNSSFRSV